MQNSCMNPYFSSIETVSSKRQSATIQEKPTLDNTRIAFRYALWQKAPGNCFEMFSNAGGATMTVIIRIYSGVAPLAASSARTFRVVPPEMAALILFSLLAADYPTFPGNSFKNYSSLVMSGIKCDDHSSFLVMRY